MNRSAIHNQYTQELTVITPDAELPAYLHQSPETAGIVVFAHGSGSSRHSRRNQFVAGQLQEAGAGTLLFDLLTPDEERLDQSSGELRFNIDLRARRVVGALDWLQQRQETAGQPVGVFGASTGAAAALEAARQRPAQVTAVVSRGGRPDMATQALPAVTVPVLLLVGENDPVVLRLNREACDQLQGTVDLRVVRGASHLFEEPGALEAVARHAQEWFTRFLHNA